MNAEAIVTDRKEGRTPFLWTQDIPVEEEYRDLAEETEKKDAVEDEMILSIQADINDQMLRTLCYTDLKEKYSDTEVLYAAITSIVSTAVRYALPYLGDYKEDDHVSMSMHVTRELYRKLELPWRYDGSLPIPED